MRNEMNHLEELEYLLSVCTTAEGVRMIVSDGEQMGYDLSRQAERVLARLADEEEEE